MNVHTIRATGACPCCGEGSPTPYLSAPDRFHLRQESHTLVQCPICELVWLTDPPAMEEMSNHYGDAYHSTITRAAERGSRWVRRHNVVRRRRRSGALLDLGCSSGKFLETFKDSTWRLYGIEISSHEASIAAERTGAEVYVGDIITAPFHDNMFDVITCFDVLEHHHQPLELLRTSVRWLKPGGILFVTLPNIACWEAIIFKSYWYGLELPRHLYHFSPKSLKTMARLAGFRNVRITTRPEQYHEHSVGYLIDEYAPRFGIKTRPLAAGMPLPLSLRTARKLFRITIGNVFRHAAWLAGAGASMDAFLEK